MLLTQQWQTRNLLPIQEGQLPVYGRKMCTSTGKPVLKATCIKQSPAFKGTISDPIEGKEVEFYLYKASTCLKQPVFRFPIGACLTQV